MIYWYVLLVVLLFIGFDIERRYKKGLYLLLEGNLLRLENKKRKKDYQDKLNNSIKSINFK